MLPHKSGGVADYSTDEVWTGGYWVDGKKIYRKVIYFSSLLTISNTSWTDTDITVSSLNIYNILFAEAITNKGPSSNYNGCYPIMAIAEGEKLKVLAARDSNPVYAYMICIQYTKTTDT